MDTATRISSFAAGVHEVNLKDVPPPSPNDPLTVCCRETAAKRKYEEDIFLFLLIS